MDLLIKANGSQLKMTKCVKVSVFSGGLTALYTKDGFAQIRLMEEDDLFILTGMSTRVIGIKTRQRARVSTLIKTVHVMRDNSFKTNSTEEVWKFGRMVRVTQAIISRG